MLNKVTLIGNVGGDPEIRSTQNGDQVASFSLATSESWKDKSTGERKTKTEWHKIVIWGGLVKIVESYVQKGSKLYIEGKLQTRSWDKDGVTMYTTEVVLKQFNGNLVMLDSRGGEQSQQAPSQAQPEQSSVDDDEIPF